MKNRHPQTRLGWCGPAGLVLLGTLCIFGVGQTWAVGIDQANWNEGRNQLEVSGSATPRADVTLYDADAAATAPQLASDDANRRGAWSIRVWGLSSPPCTVRAVDESNGQEATLDVTPQPAGCDNVPPTADAGGPYSGTVGSPVDFDGSGSVDQDGQIVLYAWSFGDGSNGSGVSTTHTYSAAGDYTVFLTVTDNAQATHTATVSARIDLAPPVNVPPTADAGGPYIGSVGSPVAFDGAGSSDGDGDIVSYAWDFGDGTNGSGVSPTHTYSAARGYTVTLTVTDDAGANAIDTKTATVTETVACKSPISEHCQITAYTGPEVCVACHEGEARDMHGSVHYQQGGAFPNVTNIPLDFYAAGERPAHPPKDDQGVPIEVATGVNTYCGTHENSPRFTCAGCHVGNGRFPMAQSEFAKLDPASQEAHAQLANIDCLMCHQEVYKRFPDWTASGEGFQNFSLLNLIELPDGTLEQSNGDSVLRTGYSGIPKVDSATQDFQFLPAGVDTLPTSVPMDPMAITTLVAAQTVHATTRKSCLNCHAGAAGANGAKRGDLSKENEDPSTQIDYHMSSAGQNLTCSDCHSETLPDGTGHRVRGRGLDLRPNDVPERFTCENGGCHSERPHGDYSNRAAASRDKHATKVACQTCHIPSYAKAAVGTEVARDWQDPHPSAAACNGRGGWLPREDKGYNLTPSYAWFDGTSEVYYLGEPLAGVPTIPLDPEVAASFVGDFKPGDPAYVLGMPNGDVSGGLETKLYPMKEHWGKLASNGETLIGHSTFEFFRTGSFCRAVAVGDNRDPDTACPQGYPGEEMPSGTQAVAVHTYQTINHGAETADNALGCSDCHGSNARMNLKKDLGYGLKGPESQVCTQCHGVETKDSYDGGYFSYIHDKHVRDKGKDCSTCHTFSRPERGLSTSIRNP